MSDWILHALKQETKTQFSLATDIKMHNSLKIRNPIFMRRFHKQPEKIAHWLNTSWKYADMDVNIQVEIYQDRKISFAYHKECNIAEWFTYHAHASFQALGFITQVGQNHPSLQNKHSFSCRNKYWHHACWLCNMLHLLAA